MKIYLHEQVKNIIAKLNWTHSDFGDKIDCDASYATKLLNGDMEASPKRRRKIMKALPEYDFNDLFIIENSNFNNQ